MADIFFLEDISDSETNPYEAVKGASAEARRINHARMVMDQLEERDKPTTLALKRLANRKVRVVKAGRQEGDLEEGENGPGERDEQRNSAQPEEGTAGS